MQQLLIYALKVIAISGLLILYYYFGLRNKRFHYYNRFYLLLTLLLSMVLPALHMQWFSFGSNSLATIKMYNIIYSGEGENITVYSGNSFSWLQFISVIFIAASILALTQLIIRVYKIYKLKNVYPVNRLSDFDFIHTDLQSAPFSFFKNIFWRKDIEIETGYGKQILQHEITHVRQKHSLDKIFVQLVLCVYWINPFFWLLKKELYLIHEFIADEKAISDNDANSFAQMLLTASYGKFEFAPAQSIFYSSIKRRLIMLTTSKKTQFSYLRRIMALPLIAAVVCLLAFTVKNQKTNLSAQKIVAAKPFKLVVDAGHGGKDDGALGNGLYEKDLNLKIAEKIKELSSQYNIDVVLTRDNDVYMSPPEKSDFANAQNADAFISIHVNNNDAKHSNQSGVEIYLARNNTKTLDNSQVLGSAILQSIQTNFNAQSNLILQKTGIWILENSNIPAALIECGYISNASDAKILKDNLKIELMAKNILQGVAMYANNSFDKNKLYQIKDRSIDTSEPKSNSMLQKQPEPLYVLDGKIVSKQTLGNSLSKPDFVISVNVLKDKHATDKYGDKAKNGVVEVTTKQVTRFSPPLIVRDSDGMVNASNISPDKIFTQAQQEPQFPGGVKGWQKFLEDNLNANVPAKKNAPPGNYTVTLSFLVDENGKVSDVKAIKNPGYGTADEAVRVIAQGPDWIPAMQNGRNVVYRQKQNITFQVSQQ